MTSPTASELVTQLQQQGTTTLDALNTVFSAASNSPTANPISLIEAQLLGGQILFQQSVNAFLNSLPTSLTPVQDSNPGLVYNLGNLLLILQNLVPVFDEIGTNDTYQQPIALSGLNLTVGFADAGIISDLGMIANTYALFVWELLIGSPANVTTAGSYTVPIPTGATWVDIILLGGGGAGGGYNAVGSGTGGTGGNTTATLQGGATYTAAGGAGGASSETTAATVGAAPGDISFDGHSYFGGWAGGAGYNSAGENATAPGAAGGGGGSYGSVGGAGGAAGAYFTITVPIPSGATEITGSVGAGGTGGAAINAAVGGEGAPGAAWFCFYS